MTREEIQSKIDDCELELRSLMDEVKNNADVKVEDIRAKKEEIEKRRADLTKELAQLNAPAPEGEETRGLLFNRDAWLKAAEEKRALQIGATKFGSVNQIKSLVKEIAEKDGVLAKASFFYGANASTVIPVLSPSIANPADYAEGATNVAVDTDAQLKTTEITPKAYVAVLPITAEALKLGIVDLEAELPDVFGRAFAKVMHSGMVTGAGTSKKMTGLFTAAADSTSGATVTELAANQTAIKLSDLATLALTVSALDEEYEIVMNPTVYGSMLADSTAGEDVKIYKESLIRDKTIEGVKVTLDAKAPTSTSAGAILCVAAPLSRYAVGIAGEIDIEAIKKVGDTNTYFQATMFFGGAPECGVDLYAIAVAD